jgi:hypothetical protein
MRRASSLEGDSVFLERASDDTRSRRLSVLERPG